MTIKELRDRLAALNASLQAAVQANLALMDSADTTAQQLTDAHAEVERIRAQMTTVQDAIADEEGRQRAEAQRRNSPTRGTGIRATAEYSRAFFDALRDGVRPNRAGEQYRILTDALTESGGTPAGSEGGFLVPDDMDTQIRELRRDLHPLATYFGDESVTSSHGWRVKEKGKKTKFAALSGEAADDAVPVIATTDQDMFERISFALTTYGLIVPVSNELNSDETAGLQAYLSRMFARNQVKLENELLLGLLSGLTATEIASTADPVAKLKEALNKALDPAISLSSVILTNQDGYNFLDQAKDSDGRPLLQPDATTDTGYRLKSREIVVLSNDALPTRVVSTTGATKGDHIPLYIGDMHEYGTLYHKEGLELTSTDIGGNSFRTNSLEVRGILRYDAKTFDTLAAVRRDIFIAAT